MLFVLPALVVLSIFLIYPAYYTIRLAFYESDFHFGFFHYLGIDNFKQLKERLPRMERDLRSGTPLAIYPVRLPEAIMVYACYSPTAAFRWHIWSSTHMNISSNREFSVSCVHLQAI